MAIVPAKKVTAAKAAVPDKSEVERAVLSIIRIAAPAQACAAGKIVRLSVS
jgi:hypothetical protein